MLSLNVFLLFFFLLGLDLCEGNPRFLLAFSSLNYCLSSTTVDYCLFHNR